MNVVSNLHDPPLGIESADYLTLRRDKDVAHVGPPAVAAGKRHMD